MGPDRIDIREVGEAIERSADDGRGDDSSAGIEGLVLHDGVSGSDVETEASSNGAQC